LNILQENDECIQIYTRMRIEYILKKFKTNITLKNIQDLLDDEELTESSDLDEEENTPISDEMLQDLEERRNEIQRVLEENKKKEEELNDDKSSSDDDGGAEININVDHLLDNLKENTQNIQISDKEKIQIEQQNKEKLEKAKIENELLEGIILK
jgi:DNA-binding transcriptional MerR regulator